MFGEYKRVFDKKTGWVIFILLAVNLSLYLYGQFTESRAGTAEDFLLYCRQYREIIAANQEDAARQWEYIESYDALFEAMDRQVEQLEAVSIFAAPDSVSNRKLVSSRYIR